MLDFPECRICTPAGAELPALYDFLGECFPSDGPLLVELQRSGFRLGWKPHVLVHGDEILGNVTLVPFQAWRNGALRPIVGVASVATARRYRRRGIARFLLEHCLRGTDAAGEATVLFTGLPEVYTGLGFRLVEQRYLGIKTAELPMPEDPLPCEAWQSLDRQAVDAIRPLYERQAPAWEAAPARDGDGWWWFQTLLAASPSTVLLPCRRGTGLAGYARVERGPDRLTVTELCAGDDGDQVVASLLAAIGEEARREQFRWITLALPPRHTLWDQLKAAGVTVRDEPPGVLREPLLVRPPSRGDFFAWDGLQWSLSDKF